MKSAGKRGLGLHLVGRRKWLQSLIIGGSLAALGGAVALVRTGGYSLAPAVRERLRTLAPWEFILVRDVARRVVAPDRSSGVVTPDEVGVAEFVDSYLSEMRPAQRIDIQRMLRFLEQLAPLRSGLLGRFTDLSDTDKDRVLSALESSGIDPLRAGFQALKGLVMMGYYRDPRTFPILGYRGPLLEEPAP
jgi:Gluconate 2-dehydrogenase subunit 3